jgi:NADH:ubiquinone oxidoreductase subunit 3 (subunit A)
VDILFSPPIALLIYIPLVLFILLIGKRMAGPEKPSELKSSIYSSGEEAPISSGVPGYRPFILIAFFFAILHLGMLVLGSSHYGFPAAIYLIGLVVGLIALILG